MKNPPESDVTNSGQYLLEDLTVNLWLKRLEKETQDTATNRAYHIYNNHLPIVTIHKLPSVKKRTYSKRVQSASTYLPAKCQPNHANIQSASTSSESLQSSFL